MLASGWLFFFLILADIPPPILTAQAPESIILLDPGHGGKDRGGLGPNGFSKSNIKVPEDPYNYDVALRILKLSEKTNWLVAFTVIDDDNKSPNNNDLLPARNGIHYNLTFNRAINTRDRISLTNRVYFSNIFNAFFPSTPIVFISIHFDHAPNYVCGARIFTWRDMRTHPFVLILNETLKADGIHFKILGKTAQGINYWNNLFVLHYGIVSPRILIELGNYNCQEDRLRMQSADGREAYAKAITKALEIYLASIKKAP